MARKSQPKQSPKPPKNTSNSWVFLIKDKALGFDEDTKLDTTDTRTPDVVSLKHPCTSEAALFLFSPDNKHVCEVLSFDEPNRSWFINETVKSDGRLHLSTPVDPLFLVLPYLIQNCTNQAQPLANVIKDLDYPEVDRLIDIISSNQLQLIADSKGNKELQAYKYNEDKTFTWLKKKVDRVSEVLERKRIHVGSGAVSATFVKSSKCEPIDRDSLTRYACGIIAEYLPEGISEKFLKHLNLTDETLQQTNKRKSDALTPQSNASKKVKNSPNETNNSKFTMPKADKPKSVSAKTKAFVKAASGSKSISSFFQKR